jgi:diguanylate cyclase (GGDEF)-like protein
LVDIDDFHQLNRTFGHVEGDRALQALTRVAPPIDSRRGFPRALRGDEFAIILGTDDQTVIGAVEARIIEGVERLNASGKLRGKLPFRSARPSSSRGMTGRSTSFIKSLAEALYSAKLKKKAIADTDACGLGPARPQACRVDDSGHGLATA